MKLAVIPARGGSKRIPRKNIKPFCGKPMIAWSIEAAKASGCFDRIIVSTDDNEIADVSREHGADVPFTRPAKLADDYTATIPVVQHAIEWCTEDTKVPDLVCCIYATAPFVRPQDLRDGLNILQEQGSDYAFAVAAHAAPIQRALRIASNGRVTMFQPEHFDTRSQDLEPAYYDAGQFYWGRAQAWLSGEPLFGEGASPVLLPKYRAQDIDTEEDWTRAEYMFKVIANSGTA